MPQMTGPQLIAELRRVDRHLPVILMTGFTESALADKLAALGVVVVLTKPLKTRELAGIVRKILDDTQPHAHHDT